MCQHHFKPSWKKINIKQHKKIVTHVSVHTLTFHETHYPLSPPSNPSVATNIELLKQVKNWQSPSRDPWSICLINSWETTKGQTDYNSGRPKGNSKTICGPPGCSTPLHSTLLCSTLVYLYSTLLHSTPLHSTPLYSTLLYSTLLYSTLLYSTPLHSTPLHSTPLRCAANSQKAVAPAQLMMSFCCPFLPSGRPSVSLKLLYDDELIRDFSGAYAGCHG